MKNIFVVAAIVGFAISIQSCKKDKDSDPVSTPPEKVCKVMAVTVESPIESPYTYTFSYNNDNKISKIVRSGSPVYTTTFLYSGNTINLVGKSGDSINSREVLTINDSGLLIRSETLDPVNDTLISYVDYEYTANGEIIKATDVYDNSEPSISTCSYSNGNLTTISSEGNIVNFEYYNDEKYRIGDYVHFLQLINFGSTSYIINKNLVKSQQQGSNISNFNYTFDSDNNISQLDIIDDTDITSILFQQVCE